MSTYAIGDVHGCFDSLCLLLDRIQFNPRKDRIWLTGDLVNRGPDSLETLRFVKTLGKSVTTVLGNHDLHLLAVIHGVRKPSPKDTLEEILRAPDLESLSDWLRGLPLLHHDRQLNFTLVHAGIHPHWSLPKAIELANELHKVLPSNRFQEFLENMYGNTPANWSDDLGTHKRRRFATNCFTRMRYCHEDGSLDHEFKGPPAKAPAELTPWYALPGRVKQPSPVIFGHWSSHPAMSPRGVVPLDRGCMWNGSLTAVNLETAENFSVSCD